MANVYISTKCHTVSNKMYSTFGFLGVLVTLLVLFLETTEAANHIILEPFEGKPESELGTDIALVLIPERGVPNTDYEVFCRMVQQNYPLRLWIGLVDTSGTTPLTLDQFAILLMDLQLQLSEKGLSTNGDTRLFLAAHGVTGHVVADYASAVTQSVQGVILLGSFLPRRHQNFPVPVLTVVGELDGLTRITRIAQTVQTMLGPAASDPDIITRNPLVILNGSNHELFITSSLPSDLLHLDIKPEVDKSVAMEKAADVTSLFIASILGEPAELLERAWVDFVTAFAQAEELTKPIRSLTNMTQEDFKTTWVRSAQMWLSGLEGKESTLLAVEGFVTYLEENPLPPVLGEDKGISFIMTFSDIVRYDDDDNRDRFDDVTGTHPQAPDEIAARMVGPERIQKYLKNTTISYNYTCKDLNYASFLTAYHSASESARNRFDSHHPGILFLPDVITDSEVLWKKTPLKIEMKGKEMLVTSISYQTKVDDSLMNESGLYFCKLLPPDKALEWIYIDALRRNVDSRHHDSSVH